MSDTIKNSYQFNLFDVVLYAKGHYKRTDSIWYDMALCLWKDGQGFGPFFGYTDNSTKTPQEECYRERIGICNIICTRVRKLLMNASEWRIEQLFTHISPAECWKVGYYTKENHHPLINAKEPPAWEYWEAVLRAHLSELSLMSAPELGHDNWALFVINESLKKDKPIEE